jgi:hypothetical protein
MGYEIIKCARDVDLYIEWSSIVESPTAVGTRAEMLGHLTSRQDHTSSNPPEARLRRADERGTSMLDSTGHDWDSYGAIYEQRGFLRRHTFTDFARAVLAEADESTLLSMLEPFEDETVGAGA